MLTARVSMTHNNNNNYRPFIAMHKILNSLPMSLPSELELISFHSASKGNLGECGLRGGYMHTSNCAVNFKRDVYKLLSISLSPNVVGNIMYVRKEGSPNVVRDLEDHR